MRVFALAIPFLFAAPVAAQLQRHDLFDVPLVLPPMDEQMELLGDVDNDGDLDVIGFDYFSGPGNSLKVSFRPLLNDGTGTLVPGVSVPIPSEAGGQVHCADVDGNGFLDVLVSTFNTHAAGAGVLVYRGLGNAQFAAPQHVSLPGNLSTLGSGDGNGDGIDDLFVVHFLAGSPLQRRAAWLLGGPGLTFPVGPSAVFPGTLFNVDGAQGDFDGDGITDFAVVTNTTTGADVSVFRTTPTSFVAVATLALGSGLSDLVATDLEGDGDLDLIAAKWVASGTHGAAPFVNQGGGTFTALPVSTLGTAVYDLSAGDWDGDGDADLVVRSWMASPSHTIRVYEQENGQFTLGRSHSIPAATWNFGAGVGDLDGDGFGDFVDSAAILFSPGRVATQIGPYSSLLTDWDGDGDLDHVDAPQLRRNDGRGVFDAPVNFWPPSPAPNQFYGGGGANGDFDGDGLHEVITALVHQQFGVTTFLAMRRLEANGDGVLIDIGPGAAPGVNIQGPSISNDVDGDGDLDFVNTTGLWLNDGTATFTLIPQAFQSYVPVAKGDVDGDGDLDLLAVRSGVPSLAVLYQTGPTSYSMTVLFGPASGTVEGTQQQLVDLDDDGDLDIVALQRISSSVAQTSTFLNDGAGVFTPGPVIAQTGLLSAGDVDGDGKTDLLLNEGGLSNVYFRTGPGLTYTLVVYATFAAIRLGDLDQDGDLDILGNQTTWNRRFEPPTAGHRRQYGLGSAGTDGRRPLLSLLGPVRAGSTPTVRVLGGYGGSVGALFVGIQEVNLPNVLPGVTAYVAPIVISFNAALSGPFGNPGAGALELPVALPLGSGGVQVYLQFALLDPAAPFGITHSNGCEMLIGQ